MAISPPETRASLILRLPDAADVEAWDEFVAIYEPVLNRMALRLGMQNADAENLSQEVFLAVARSLEGWLKRTDRGGFRAWLMLVARNQAVNLMTRRATRPMRTNLNQVDELDAIVDSSSSITGQLDWEYRRELFRWAANQVQAAVAEHTWQAFWLTHVEGHSIADAARQLNTTVGNIYFARSRVMSRLQELIKRYEEET